MIVGENNILSLIIKGDNTFLYLEFNQAITVKCVNVPYQF